MKSLTMLSLIGLLAGCSVSESTVTYAPPAAEPWGKTAAGEEAHLFTLKGQDGLELVVSDFGGRLVKCLVPGKDGEKTDVTPGWDTVGEYETLGFSMGTLIGRFGNRIKDGRFTLDGQEYQLPLNEIKPAPRNCNLHSGPVGWDAKVWKAEPFVEQDDPAKCVQGVAFTLVSPDGDMGFPGTVTAKVTYRVLPGNIWRIDYEATTDKPTVVNLTHHSYWNMAGCHSGNVLGQYLKINADAYTQTDAGLIPTKDAPVKGTGFDFTKLRPLGAKMDWMKAQPELAAMDNWYDHNFVLNGKVGEMKLAAEMVDPASGRALEIWTTEPCMQMYGAQNMTDELPGKDGKKLCQFAAVALETQHYPDSPNHPEFPTTVLRPGETFKSTTEYRFTTKLLK